MMRNTTSTILLAATAAAAVLTQATYVRAATEFDGNWSLDLTDGRKVQIRPAPPAQMSQNHDSNSIGGSPQKSLSASRCRSPYVPPSNQSPAVSVSVS